MQLKFADKQFVIVPFGGAGVGKSTVCNFLVSGKDEGPFIASKTTEGGETRDISYRDGYALGNKSNGRVKVVDMPGLADPTLPIL